MARELKRGVTLAEALLAMGLAVAVVLVAVQLAVAALGSHQKSTDRTAASALAARALDDYAYNLPSVNDPFWALSTFTNPVSSQETQLGSSRFTTSLHLRDASALGSGNKVVTANVTWGSGELGRAGQGSQVVTLSRLIYAH